MWLTPLAALGLGLLAWSVLRPDPHQDNEHDTRKEAAHA
jgi:hypothetical protein